MARGVMKCMERKRVLYMAVLNDWVMESLCSLGSGSMYHLSYHPSLIAPELTMEIREGRLATGNPVQIVLHKKIMKIMSVIIVLTLEVVMLPLLHVPFFWVFGGFYCKYWNYFACYDCAIYQGINPEDIYKKCGG